MSKPSHLGTALQAIMSKNKVKALDVSRLTKAGGHHLSSSYLSRLINGRQEFIPKDDLVRLAATISRDPREHADLFRARLLDELPEPGFKLVSVVINGKNPPNPMNTLSPAGRKALSFLLARGPEIEPTIVNLAKLTGMKP